MTSIHPSEPPKRVAILGTGMIGTSIGLAAARAAMDVTGWDLAPEVAARAAASGSITAARTLEDAVEGADLVVVCTPIAAIAQTVARALAISREAVVTDTGSIKTHVADQVARLAAPGDLPRFVPGHPMGGSERSGPEHASASVVDDIVWVVAPTRDSSERAVALVGSFVMAVGARAARLTPERHDRLVAFVSHLPQVASTTLMGLAATERSDEPDILLLAAGGFRDLTRLASSDPSLWSEILLANREQISEAIDLFVGRLQLLRDEVVAGRAAEVERTFDDAKRARLDLAAKPQVRAGVAVLQVPIPDEPGALARMTNTLAEGDVNIEDLQIVHSPEGGRGTVHLTVALSAAEEASAVLGARGYDPIRLA